MWVGASIGSLRGRKPPPKIFENFLDFGVFGIRKGTGVVKMNTSLQVTATCKTNPFFRDALTRRTHHVWEIER